MTEQLADFLNNSKLTGHNTFQGWNENGDALIKIRFKYKDFVFNEIIIADEYIVDYRLPHGQQIKTSIYNKHFVN